MKARQQTQLRGVLFLSLALGMMACEPREEIAPQNAPAQAPASPTPESPTAPIIVREPGAMPTDASVLAQGSGIQITMADFEGAMRRSLLFAPEREDGGRYHEVPPERLATSHVQITATQGLVAREIVRAEAARRSIRCETFEAHKLLVSHPQLARFAPLLEAPESFESAALLAELAELALDAEDLRELACEELLTTKLEASLLAGITDEELWAAYRQARDTVDLVMVTMTNTPASSELDSFLEQDAVRENSLIEAHYNANLEHFVMPRAVRLTMLKAPAGQSGAELTEKLQQAANRLSSGEAPQAAASGLGLVLETGSVLLAAENPRAYGAQVGDTGFEAEGARGFYAWQVEGFREPEPLALTRPLRREIAADLLRGQGIVASARAKLEPALSAMRAVKADKHATLSNEQVERLREEIAAQGLTLVRSGPFGFSQQGYLPGVGLAQEAVTAAFSLTAENPTLGEPVLARDRVFAFRLAARDQPSRDGFKQELADFRESFIASRRTQIVGDFVSSRQAEAGVEINTLPLRIKYGVLKKQ
ncbi:MAG: peptidyl-prolyl cis-trans isomerase [Bradymonadaceae bacterium]|nr:peptidyl-prolyl cis-trans isomerase [Lujinxingiaceae bacterium]